MKYRIGRPINGISLNGNEYLCDEDGKQMLFDTKELCKDYIDKNVVHEDTSDEEIEELIWQYKGE
tara:strand:- start:730 stop:924 length:195 start_codon:yes stop_codon:yes gene_type:complete